MPFPARNTVDRVGAMAKLNLRMSASSANLPPDRLGGILQTTVAITMTDVLPMAMGTPIAML